MKMSTWLLLLFALMGVFLFVVSLVAVFYGISEWIFGACVGVVFVMAAIGEAQRNKL